MEVFSYCWLSTSLFWSFTCLLNSSIGQSVRKSSTISWLISKDSRWKIEFPSVFNLPRRVPPIFFRDSSSLSSNYLQGSMYRFIKSQKIKFKFKITLSSMTLYMPRIPSSKGIQVGSISWYLWIRDKWEGSCTEATDLSLNPMSISILTHRIAWDFVACP